METIVLYRGYWVQLSGGRFCAPGSVRPAPSFLGGRPPLPSPWSCGRRGGCSAPSRCHAAPYGGSVAPLPPVFIVGRLRCGRAWGGFMGRPGWGCCKLQGGCNGCKAASSCKAAASGQSAINASSSARRPLREQGRARLQGVPGCKVNAVGGLTPHEPKARATAKASTPPEPGGNPQPPRAKQTKQANACFRRTAPDSSGRGRLCSGGAARWRPLRLRRRAASGRTPPRAAALRGGRRAAAASAAQITPPEELRKVHILCSCILTPVCAAAHEHPSGWGVDILTPVCYTMYGGC